MRVYTNLFAENPKQTCIDDEKHTRKAVVKYSTSTHTHTHTDYTLHTYVQVRMGEETTFANDVHRFASKVWTLV